MTDNVTITSGANSTAPDGTVIATDDVGSAHYQVIKLALGADGAIDTLVDSGQQIMANSIPTVLASDQSSVATTVNDIEDGAGDSVMDAANNAIRVNIIAGAGSGGTAMADDSAFTVGVTNMTPAGAMFDDASPDSVDEGDAGVVRMSANRNLYTTIRDAAGNERGANVDASGYLQTSGLITDIQDGAGDSIMDAANDAVRVNLVAGGAAGGTSMTDDAAFTPGTTSITPVGGTFDDASPDSIDEGDAGVFRMSANRAQHIMIRDGAGNERGANVDASGNLQTDIGAISSAPLNVIGGGTEAAALRVTLANDSTGLLSIDDNGGSLTIDNADLTTLAGTVAAGQIQVDIVAEIPAGTQSIGTLGANSGVDIGDVDVLSIIPGVAATNLGKAEDAVAGTGDTGVMVLAVRQDDANTLVDADGDYSPLTTNEHGCLNVDAQHYYEIDDCNATTGWSALNDDTDNITTDLNHVFGTASLEFDKVDGSGTVFGCVQKTISSFSANKHIEEGGGFILYSIYMSSIADIDYAFLRLGTDSSNYNEWQIQDEDLAIGWNNIRMAITAPAFGGATGNGWNSGAITYIAIGVALDAEDDTLSGILVDSILMNSGFQTSSDITAAVSSSVTSPNVRVNGWLGSVDTGSGNLSAAGTLRVVNATDDTNLSGIFSDTTSMDTNLGTVAGAVAAGQMQVDVVAALPAGTNAIGKLAANTGVDIGDVDVTSVVPGTGATNLGKAEDLAHSSGDVGVAAMTVRANTATALSGADNDYQPLITDTNGRLHVLDQNSAAILADTANMDTNLGTIAGAVAAGQMQVDVVAALPVGSNAIGKLAANTGVDIGDVDVTSVIPGVGATNLGKAEDAGHTSGDVGVAAMSVRADTAAALSGADNDYQPLITDANGRLHVLDQNSAAILADTANMDTNLGTLAGAVAAGQMQVDVVAALPAGTNAIGKLAANTGVDIGDVDVTSVIPGTGATNLGKAEDLAHSSGDVGVAAMTVRANTATALSGADNDYQPLITDTNGRLHVLDQNSAAILADTANMDTNLGTIAGAVAAGQMQVDVVAALPVGSNAIGKLAANTGVDIGDVDVTSGPTGASAFAVQGTAAEDAAVVGNPVMVGGRYHASVVAADAVDDGDAALLLIDSVGGVVRGHRTDAWSAQANYGAAQTDTSVKATPGANLALYVTDILFTTEGINNIFLESGATTIVPTVYLAATGGWSAHFQTPIRWPTNTAITITSSGAVNHSVLISGYIAP